MHNPACHRLLLHVCSPVNNSLQSVNAAIASTWNALAPWLSWETVKIFGNSAFTTSLVGALSGAFAGAVAAQHVAERSKLRDELTKEIRNINAAITLAFSVVNGMLALKQQHVRALKTTYDEERARHADYSAKRSVGLIQGNSPYLIKADFRSIPIMSPPVATVQEVVFGRLSATGRPLSLTASLAEAVGNLNASIAKRNELVELFKEGQFPKGADLPAMYLGLPYDEGHLNQEYGDTVEAIAMYTDDAIFFSHLLCRDLREYGLKVVEQNRNTLKGAPPRVTEVDFTLAQESKLLPEDDKYATWFTAFQPSPESKPKRWWLRNG